MGADGVVNMYAGPQIGRGVRFIQMCDYGSKYVFSGHYGRAKMMPIWPQGGDNQENGHSGKKEYAGLIIFLFVFKKAVHHNNGNISKPKEIRDYKNFPKRNQVINAHVNNGCGVYNRFFQISEPSAIDHRINHKRDSMFVFFIKLFHNFLLIINLIADAVLTFIAEIVFFAVHS